MKKVTVRMVGKAAGVSHSTVSRVLNSDPRVHPVTRDRVLAAAREMGYLIECGNGRRTVALILGSNRIAGYISSALAAMLSELRECGYRAELVNAADIELLGSRAVTGAIAIALDDRLNERWSELPNLPLVRLNAASSHRDNIYSVNSDGLSGMKLAVDFLIGHGHRRIAFLSEERFDRELVLPAGRYRGFCTAMRAAGVVEPEAFCYFSDRPRPVGRAWRDTGITAGICVGELHGAVAARQLYEEGIRIPEEFSLLSLEHPSVSENLIPPHTTLSQDFPELARRAVALLDNLIGHRAATDIMVPYRLVVRRSVRRLGQ